MLPFFESRNSPISFFMGPMRECPSHFHREVEVFYVLDGMSELEISEKRKKLYEGDLAIIFPNELHTYIGSENNKHATIIFDPLTCYDFFSVFMNTTVKNPFVGQDEQPIELKEALKNMITVLKKDPAAPDVLIKGHLTVLLYHALNCVSAEKKASCGNSDIAAQVINYVSLHYLEPMSLASISTALGYSKYEISRVFSKKLGIHFNKYLNSRRTEYAVALLKDTSKPITEIAFASGFESLRTFYRVFFNKYKVSPMKYRMNNSDPNVLL